MKYTDDPTCVRTYVTLCVTGEDLVPGDVSKAFDLVPSTVSVKGELRRPTSSTVNALGGWFLSSQDCVASSDFRLHLEWLLSQLIHKKQVLRWVREQGWSPVVSCLWESARGHGGPELTPQLIGRLADLDLGIWFDVYLFDDDG